MSVVNNFFGHLRTITKHRHMVIKHCKKAGILWQGLRHDLSKYSPTEFVPGVKYYTGTKSPKVNELIKGILSHGYIIKEEINIILSIGWTIVMLLIEMIR